ncbi:hypothetical protein pdam_00012295 [Pocillopora damicornis]|uniref:Uncharacterized protein n=1 Tax=Pocillopora damicornis TaxID=46731 RepID=A0A3M6T9S5_POCDA|nr:hypothetical protein pdam_00012295 [Pocillopora damicornis]
MQKPLLPNKARNAIFGLQGLEVELITFPGFFNCHFSTDVIHDTMYLRSIYRDCSNDITSATKALGRGVPICFSGLFLLKESLVLILTCESFNKQILCCHVPVQLQIKDDKNATRDENKEKYKVGDY